MTRSRPGVAAALVLAILCLPAAAAAKAKRRPEGAAPPAAPQPLAEKSVDEILAQYTFVGDFSEKDPRRDISDELFWPYQLQIPDVTFPIDDRFKLEDDMPSSAGGGRAYEHLNRGRLLFRDGDYKKATNTWLAGRALFGTKYPHHRRSDYFIGMGFLRQAEALQQEMPFTEPLLRSTFDNATTFLSWAFVVKTDVPDPLLDRLTPKGLYNLAAIYWLFDRKAGAYGAATTGLNFLRKTGRREYRPQFHRFVAEAAIGRQDWLAAVQELDTAIRQDRDVGQAAAAFARVGDIYFTLGNYELAEDAYALGARLDEVNGRINPAQLVLRGESLFWLGRFSEAQKILAYALERHLPQSSGKDTELAGGPRLHPPDSLTPELRAWAALRVADAYLARWAQVKDKQSPAATGLKDQAALAYYKVAHDFREFEAGRTAAVRQACLELPAYETSPGHNVEHARALLEEAKSGSLPEQVREMAWACQVTSYTDTERTPEMLERVRAFANANPDVRFLKPFVEPVRAYQASRIDEYFGKGDLYRALSFFEKNRKTLFPHVDAQLARQLFAAYADLHRPNAAAEFWGAYAAEPDSDLKVLRQAVVAAELAESAVKKQPKGPWAARDLGFQRSLVKRTWTLKPEKLAVTYLDRMQALDRAKGHVPWMYNLARHFSESDARFICDFEYPLLSRLGAAGDSGGKLVDQRLAELIATELPELFRHDESCGLSLLELEAARSQHEPAALAGRYLKRQNWPLVGGFLHLYWTISEKVYDAGDHADARELWRAIRDKGSPASPEVGFAKARLDPTKTELEKLWD